MFVRDGVEAYIPFEGRLDLDAKSPSADVKKQG
jgi:hypothetical protein